MPEIFDKYQSRKFTIAAFLNLFILLVISMDYILSRTTTANGWIFRNLTSFCNFALCPFIPLLLYKIFYVKKTRWWLYAPACLNILLCFSASESSGPSCLA